MIILGIDPGTTSVGYAILKITNNRPRLLGAGLISIKSRGADNRLKDLHLEIKKVVRRWKPTVLAIERIFFAKNQKTALAVSEARGATLLTTALAGLKFYEYTPLEVKRVITGDGRADKAQLQKMIQLTLPETKTWRAEDDVFDAAALALTYYFKEGRWSRPV